MSEREPMNRRIAPSDAGADPRDERLRALYTGAYEPVSPSESLRARVETIIAGGVPTPKRRTAAWQRQPVSWPGGARAAGRGAAGAAVLAIRVSLPLSPRRSFSTASAADLAYLNGDPGIGFPRWTQRPAGGWEQIEAGIRRQTPVKDDFVTIPFPRLVSTSDRQIAAAAESYQ